MAEPPHENSKQQQNKLLVKEFVGERQSAALKELIKYTKMLGSYLVKGMNTFSELFKKNLQGKTQFKEGKEEIEEEQRGQENIEKKRRGFRVDFSQFKCDERQLESVRLEKPETQVRPVRSFNFNVGDFPQENSLDVSSKEDLSFLLNRISSKKLKKDLTCFQTDSMCKVIELEKPEMTVHWNKLSNKITEEWVIAVSNCKAKCQKEKKRNQANDEYVHQQYIKDVSRNLAQRSSRNGGKRLSSLMRSKKQKVQARPRKKYTHIQEEEAPQIYNVQRVLSVLEKQKEQFMQEKRRIIQQKLRAEREARRLEQEALQREREARQRERKAVELLEAQRKQEEERRLREQQESESRERQVQNQVQSNVLSQNKENEESKRELSAISQKEEQNIENQEDNNYELSLRRKRNTENIDSISRISSKSIQQSLQKSEKIQKVEEVMIPPQPETPKKQSPKEDVSSIPVLSQEKRKNNPFIKNNQAVGLSLQDLISKDRFTPFQTNINSSPSNFRSLNIFAQTPVQEKQEPAHTYSSPTNFMSNQIGNIFPSNPVPSAPAMPLTSPNSLMNQQPNSSYQSSNGNSSFANQQPPSFNPNQQNGQSLLSLGGSSGLGMFTNNSNAVRLFQNNIFMSQTQKPSLFSDTSHSRQEPMLRTGSRSRKNPVRIS